MTNNTTAKPPIPNSYQIDISQTEFKPAKQAQLWAGEYPGNGDPDHLRQRIQNFLDHEITYFINLTEAAERADHYEQILQEEAEKKKLRVTHKRFAIRDYTVPNPPLVQQILDDIDRSLQQGQKTYIHCWGGIGRTGTVIGCWLVRHGLSGQEALYQIAQWRSATPKGDHPSPETNEQKQFILQWEETE